MVRLHWHVEDGRNAFVPPRGLKAADDSVVHADVQIELPQEGGILRAVFTLPAGYQEPQQGRDVGLVLSTEALDWQQKLAAEVAARLSAAGFVVAWSSAQPSESEASGAARFEKMLDACATSPYARNVKRWVLAGIGAQGRVAVIASRRCRGTLIGYAFISYPLEAPLQSYRHFGGMNLPGETLQNSDGLLHQLTAPRLFVTGEMDELCRPQMLMEACTSGRLPSPDSIRLFVLPGVGADLGSGQDQTIAEPTSQQVIAAVLEFVSALHRDALTSSTLPCPQPVSVSQPMYVPTEGQELRADREVQLLDNSEPDARFDDKNGSIST